MEKFVQIFENGCYFVRNFMYFDDTQEKKSDAFGFSPKKMFLPKYNAPQNVKKNPLMSLKFREKYKAGDRSPTQASGDE